MSLPTPEARLRLRPQNQPFQDQRKQVLERIIWQWHVEAWKGCITYAQKRGKGSCQLIGSQGKNDTSEDFSAVKNGCDVLPPQLSY